MRRWLVCLALTAGVTGCTERVDVDGARAAIMEADRAWSQTPPDVDKFVGFFAPDGTFNPPNMPAADGTDAIRKVVSELVAMPGFSVRWTATRADAGGSGDLGYSVGTYELTVNDPTGKPATDRGKYVTVWKKQADGQWKVVADIFNSDLPPPPPPTTSAAPPPAPK